MGGNENGYNDGQNGPYKRNYQSTSNKTHYFLLINFILIYSQIITIIKKNGPKMVSDINFLPLICPFSFFFHFLTDYRSEEAKERRRKRSAEYKLRVQKQLMLENQLKDDQLRLETQKALNITLQLAKELVVAFQHVTSTFPAQQATSAFVVQPTIPTNSPKDE